MSHIQITFVNIQPEQQEWTIAHLSEAGYEGFEERERELIAYISADIFDRELLKELAFKYQLEYREDPIPEQNWNTLWESNFPPVVIGDFVAIRADFHPPIKGVQHEIVITPKMSFGTGHHATTSMMIEQMHELQIRNKNVFDFGTGTGILAILAEKLGANSVVAVDNDDWSIENARENIERNNCSRITVRRADTMEDQQLYDVILANINKHVIEEQFPFMVKNLAPGGSLLLSGLLSGDKNDIIELAGEYPVTLVNSNIKDNWLSMHFGC